MAQYQNEHGLLREIFFREVFRCFGIGSYTYSPTIFLRKHPAAFITARLLAAYGCYLCCVLTIAHSILTVFRYDRSALVVQMLVVPMLYISFFLAIFSITLQGLNFGKKHLHFSQLPPKYKKEISGVYCAQTVKAILIGCGICLIVVQKFSHIWIRRHWHIDISAVLVVMVMLWIMIILTNMIMSYRLTKSHIYADYHARIAQYHKIFHAQQVDKPKGVLLVGDDEIEKNASRPQLLQPYLGDLSLEDANLSTIKIQFLINKISANIMQLKIFLQIFTVLGGFLSSRLIAFEYTSISQHEHLLTGKHIIAMFLIFSYISTLLLISIAMENKNQALKIVQDYQKKLPEAEQIPIAGKAGIPEKLSKNFPLLSLFARKR